MDLYTMLDLEIVNGIKFQRIGDAYSRVYENTFNSEAMIHVILREQNINESALVKSISRVKENVYIENKKDQFDNDNDYFLYIGIAPKINIYSRDDEELNGTLLRLEKDEYYVIVHPDYVDKYVLGVDDGNLVCYPLKMWEAKMELNKKEMA